MEKAIYFTEIVFSALDPERVMRLADECLVDLRVIESRKEPSGWIHEYEVKGEAGKIEKFRVRLKSAEINPEI
jgi:hypothetical protein